MKKNLIFLAILALLLTLTYFFEEKKQQQNFIQEEKIANTLQEGLEFEKLSAIELKNVKIDKKEDLFFVAQLKFPASVELIQDFLLKLNRIKVKRILSADEIKSVEQENFLRKDNPFVKFSFNDDKVIEFIIGKKLEFNESFYLKIKRGNEERYVIAFHDLLQDGFIGDQKEADEYQYEELVTLLKKNDHYFLEKELLSSKRNIQTLKTAQIENNRNRPFLVDFKEIKTTPIILNGVSYEKEFFAQFLERIKKMAGDSLLFDSDYHQLSEMSSKMLLTFDDGQEIVMKLYTKYKERSGYFLTTSEKENEKIIYELSREAASLLFLNVQDFWSKAILGENNLFNRGDVIFSLIFDRDKKFKLRVPFNKNFSVEIIEAPSNDVLFTPRMSAFNSLFLMLTASYGERALRVSPLSEGEKKKHQEIGGMTIIFPDMDIRIVKIADEMIVDHNQNLYKVHYLIGEKNPFDFDVDSFFYQKKVNAGDL